MLRDLIGERIRRLGPLPFDQFVDLALYHPEGGFYARGAGAGRARDFLTSPEVSPLFGAVVGRALDGWWDEMGRPDPFVVVEAAAGAGTLGRDVLAAAPACAPALRYLLVERSGVLREAQAEQLPLVPAALVLGPAEEEDDDGAVARPVPGLGPLAASLAELPAGPLTGVVLANELLDNLAFGLLERRHGGWWEVRVGEGGGGALAEVHVPAAPATAEEADRLAPGAEPGARVPLQHQAREWLRQALALLDRGRVVAIDYAATTAELAAEPWERWLRTFRGHGPGGHPLDQPGDQDVTCVVCVDQLARVRVPASDRSQAEFLAAHGLDGLVAEARAAWQAAAARPDLAALRARSRVDEAAALTDPAGLGAFRVLEWPAGRPDRGQ